MKKLFYPLFLVGGLALITTSCGKKQTCECVYTDNGTESNRMQSTINEGSEEKNKESCDQGDNVTTTTLSNGYTSTSKIECEIID